MNGWIFATGLLVFGSLRVWLTRQARARAQRDLPARPTLHDTLGAAAEGEYVELTGRIRAREDSLTAALSGTPCVAYVAIARVWHAKRKAEPIAVETERKLVPVVVTLPDGEVAIDDSCQIECPTAALSPRVPEREAAFLEHHKLGRYHKSAEFEEGVVRSGDTIWVRGVVARARLVAGPNRPLVLGRPDRGDRPDRPDRPDRNNRPARTRQ